MNASIFSFAAAGCAALSNLFFRKNSKSDTQESLDTNGYLVCLYLFSFLLSLVSDPDLWQENINLAAFGIGACVGILNVLLMRLTAQALKCGPAGLTFAFQNASAMFPGVVLFLLFGSEFGFTCSLSQLLGITLVLIGLFLGTKKISNRSEASWAWLKIVLFSFIIQILALSLIQGRCLLFDSNIPLFTITEQGDKWFMPGQFGAALLWQLILFIREKNTLSSGSVIYGSLSGLVNFASTGLLLLATKHALPFEKGILFPCFSVATMLLCNLWANQLYKEPFNLKTNALCAFGIFMGISF
jgi:hypothetical protein